MLPDDDFVGIKESKNYCFCCSVHIDMDEDAVEDHVKSSAHLAQKLSMLSENFVIKDMKAKSTKDYYCFFCDSSIDAVLEHINDPIHQTNKDLPDKKSLIVENTLKTKNKFFFCECCKKPLSTCQDIKEHIESQIHAFKLQSFALDAQLLKTLAENYVIIALQKCQFHCFFCNTFFVGILDHINSPTHQLRKESPEIKSLISENGIVSMPKFFYCSMCSKRFFLFRDMETHVKGQKHLKEVRLSNSLESDKKEALIIKQKLDKLNNLESAESERKNDTESSYLKSEELLMLSENFVRSSRKRKEKKKYYCFFCDTSTNVALEHLNDPIHQSNKNSSEKKSLIAENTLTVRDPSYFCKCCERPIWTFPEFQKHIVSQRHVFKLKNPIHDAEMLKKLEENYIIIQELHSQYYCLFCDTSFVTILDHLDDPAHQLCKESPEKKSLMAENSIIPMPKFYHCNFCYIRFWSLKQGQDHITGREHARNIKMNKIFEAEEAEALAIKRKLDKLEHLDSPSEDSSPTNTTEPAGQENVKKVKFSPNDRDENNSEKTNAT